MIRGHRWQETKLIFQSCFTKIVTIERMDTIDGIFWTFLFVIGRKQDFLHFAIHLVFFLLKALPVSNLDGTFLLLDTRVSLKSRSTSESWTLSQRRWKLSLDRSDTRTLKTLLANDFASLVDVSGFWILFETTNVFPSGIQTRSQIYP